MRSARDMLGNLDSPSVVGVRHTPGYSPTPNSEPLGSMTGAPPRTRLFSLIIPKATEVVVDGDQRYNRVVLITPPSVGFTVYVGDSGVTALTGMALLPGQVNEIVLVGFQPLYAISDAPVQLRVQVQVAAILLAERERRL